MIRTWRFEDVKAQCLHGNVHLLPGTSGSGRLTRSREARCLAIAAAGIRTVQDIIINSTDGSSAHSGRGWDLADVDTAIAFYPGVTRADYESILASIPDEWKLTLQEGPASLWTQGDIISNQRGRPVLRITRPPTHLRPGQADVLTWRGATAALVETGDTVTIHHANASLTDRLTTRISELPVSTEEEYEALTAPGNESHPRAIDLAEAQRLSLHAVGIRGHGLAEDTQKLGYVRPCTVRMPRLASLGSATTGRLYKLKCAQAWQPMRTIDARQPRAHYYPWIQRHPPALQQRIVAQWVDQTSAGWLPGRALDLLPQKATLRLLHGPREDRPRMAVLPPMREGPRPRAVRTSTARDGASRVPHVPDRGRCR